MADEGIMALPQGMGMQDEQPQGQQPTVTSADSYDAAQTALGRVNPGEQAALKEALRQNIGNLQLTPQQLDALIQVFEYVSQHPGDYVNLLQKMLEAGVLDEGDMPPEYDPEFIGAMLAVLNEMQQMQAAGAQEPMDLSPVVQGLQPMGMASGGLADIGQYLASKGRGGDSMLAHINPEEAAMLKRRGGSGTINPNTGLPEFKEGALGGVFDAIGGALKGVANVAKDLLQSPVGRILGTVALATVLGPAGIGLTMSSATAAGLAGAGVSLLGGGSMKEALISGAMGYIGGGGTIMGANPLEAVGKYLPGAAGGALNTGLATGLIGAGIGKLGGMSTEDALKMGLVSGVSAGGMKAFVGDPESYAIKSKILKLAEAGDQTALALRDSNNVGDMKAYIDSTSAPVSTTAPGPVPTAAELLKQQSSSPFPGVPPATDAEFAKLMQGYQQPPSAAILGTTELPGVSPQQAALNANNLGAGVERPLLSSNTPPPFSSSFSSPGQQAALDANNLGMLPGTQPTGFFDKALTGAGEMYTKYLSPDRAGLPTDVSFFRKYGPLAAAGTATIAAFGGMDSSPAEIDAMTAAERARYEESRLRARARREFMEKGGYGLEKPVFNTAYDPVVPASYRPLPTGTPGAVVPAGVTQSPAGVAQPYNVAGLYGVPLLYGPDGQLRRMAKGGMIRRFSNGGDAGYGYGEGEGAAQGSGMGGYGSLGEGYGDGDNANLTSRRVMAGDTMSRFPGAPSNAPPGYFGRVTIAPEATAPSNAPPGYFGRVTLPSEESAEYSNAMRDVGALNTRGALSARDRLEARSDAGSFAAPGFGDLGQFAGSFAEGADGRAKGGYIGRFSNGGDAGYEERRQRAQDRRDFMERGGYGLEGPVLDTSYRNVLSPLRMTGTVGQLDQYDGVNNSGDQRGPGSGPAGGIPGLNIDPLALGLGRVAGLFGSSVSLGKPAPVDERSSYTPAALAEFQAAIDREAQAEANVAGYEGQGNFLGGSDSFGEGQYAKGGPAKMTRFPRRDGPINGPGTGTSDNIPAMLSDGEFVFTAKAVRNAGGGSRRKGAARMYKLMKKLEGGAVKGN